MSVQLTPLQAGRIAVLLGGRSAEREVSLRSGRAVCAALQRGGFDATPFDPSEHDLAALQRFDCAWIALHGRGGEDGTIQGVLEHLGLPYTGSGVLGSALAMDKWRCKRLWQGAGLPTPRGVLLHADAGSSIEELGWPVIVKPTHEGSSIGMTRVDRAEELEAACRSAAVFDDTILVEEWIDGVEYTVAVLGHQALPSIRLETPRSFFDYQAKYGANDTAYFCPSGLSAAEEAELAALSLRAFAAVGASGCGRVDLMCDRKGAWWLLEVNTVPGMTTHSLVPKAAAEAGIGFDELVVRILEEALP